MCWVDNERGTEVKKKMNGPIMFANIIYCQGMFLAPRERIMVPQPRKDFFQDTKWTFPNGQEESLKGFGSFQKNSYKNVQKEFKKDFF